MLYNLIRVEAADGKGMYRNDIVTIMEIDELADLRYRHSTCNDNGMPTPENDGIRCFKEGLHYCGYKSLEQIQQWIMPEEFSILIREGFRIYLYVVTELLESRNQVVFDKNNVRSKIDITSIFE